MGGIRPSCHPEAVWLCTLLCTGLPDLDVSGHTHYEAGALTPDLCFRSPSVLVWLLSAFKVLCMLGSWAHHKSDDDSNIGFMRSCSASQSKLCKLWWECPSLCGTADTLPEPAIISAQALFLQGAHFTVMVLTLRKEPGIF